jgi:hypothetical protein
MSKIRTITNRASDEKAGMTLRELGRFVQDAMNADADQDAVVKITVTWRQSIKEISVTSETED